MNRYLKLVLLLLTGLTLNTTLHADIIRISSDEWCPYNCDPKSEKPGYIIEIATIIFEKQGHTVEYSSVPWARAIKYAKEGKIEALPGATKGEVTDFIFPSESFGASQTYFFSRNNTTWQYDGVDSIKSVNVGIQDNYEYGSGLDDYFQANKGTKRVQIVGGESPLRTNIRKLQMGRIEVIPEDKAVFRYTAKDMGLSGKIKEVGVMEVKNRSDFEEMKLYLAFSPRNPNSKKYAEILSSGIQEMRASGELRKILAKYGLKDWKKELDSISKRFQAE